MEPAVSAVLAQQVSARPVRHRHGSALARSPRRPLPGARASNQWLKPKVARVDPAHLARAFRAHYGTTAGAYLRALRVRRATDALARSTAAHDARANADGTLGSKMAGACL